MLVGFTFLSMISTARLINNDIHQFLSSWCKILKYLYVQRRNFIMTVIITADLVVSYKRLTVQYSHNRKSYTCTTCMDIIVNYSLEYLHISKAFLISPETADTFLAQYSTAFLSRLIVESLPPICKTVLELMSLVEYVVHEDKSYYKNSWNHWSFPLWDIINW